MDTNDKKTVISIVAVIFFVILAFGSVDSGTSSSSSSRPSQDRSTQSSRYTSQHTSTSQSAWYKGGTLHRATMREWNSASYSNRLATCADFVAASDRSIDMATMRERAVNLERAITEAGRGGYADNKKVTEIAAASLIVLGYKR